MWLVSLCLLIWLLIGCLFVGYLTDISNLQSILFLKNYTTVLLYYTTVLHYRNRLLKDVEVLLKDVVVLLKDEEWLLLKDVEWLLLKDVEWLLNKKTILLFIYYWYHFGTILKIKLIKTTNPPPPSVFSTCFVSWQFGRT